MAEHEREIHTTTPEGDPAYIRTRTTTDEDVNRVYVRRGSSTPWLIAAIVAVVAIIAIAFLMTRQTEPNANDIAAAVDAGRAAGYAEGAATAVGQLPQTATTTTIPVPVPVPTDNGSSVYAERSAAEAAAAAAEARAAAESAADAAARADSNTTVTTNTMP